MLHRLNILQEAINKQFGVKGVADETFFSPRFACKDGRSGFEFGEA